MQKKKKETKKPLPPSKSGVRRGEQVESKVAKVLTTVGVGILVALVVALVIALIVISVTNRKGSEESPFKDLYHVVYEDVEHIVVHKEVSFLNQKEEPNTDAYNEIVNNQTTYIVFYRSEHLKDEEFVKAVKRAFAAENIGVVLFNLSNDSKILSDEDPILMELGSPNYKLEPFLIKITGSDHNEFEFTSSMEFVINILNQ